MLDIAENSLAAGASRIELSVELDRKRDRLRMQITDNGKGMNSEVLERISDPFFTSRTTRRVGMGIPLIRQHAEMTGGSVEIHSEERRGTRLTAEFVHGHPDLQPLGDIEGCWFLLAAANPGIDILLRCSTELGEFEIGSEQVLKELQLENLSGVEIGVQLKRLIRNNLEEIRLIG
jgi:hypothetical protein